MSIAIERPPVPDIGPIGNLTKRPTQSDADALIRLHQKGEIFTLSEFGEALGESRPKKFLKDAERRGLVQMLDGWITWKKL